MLNPSGYFIIAIIVSIILSFIIRGVVHVFKWGFYELEERKRRINRTTILLISLFSLSFLLVIVELISYLKEGSQNNFLLSVFTLALIANAFVLHYLLNKKSARPVFELNEKLNPHAKKDFLNICRYFNDRHQLFEKEANDLLELIDKDSQKGTVFNIRKDSTSEELFDKEKLFYLFLQILKEKCIKTTNLNKVAVQRFSLDGKPLLDSKINLETNSNNFSQTIKRRVEKIKTNEKNFFLILRGLEYYHVSFTKNSRKMLTATYLSKMKKNAK